MKPLILIIEDELLIADYIKKTIEPEGYEVMMNITSATEGIRYIEEFRPSLVLIDINLNGEMEGTKVAQYLQKIDSIPYIYITSHTDKLTLEKVKDTRPNGFIAKPFKSIDIITKVAIVLNNYAHRKIDPVPNNIEVLSDVPFRIKQTVNYINENINGKIELHKVAALTNWQTTHFIRMFTKYMGVTPYQYILRRKIYLAKAWLEETPLPATVIAFELGFESYSNFCSAFKKFTTQTPDNYRKKRKAGNGF
jgi:AraC-like DNA-binding protein/CheY-like chemotaxis protein